MSGSKKTTPRFTSTDPSRNGQPRDSEAVQYERYTMAELAASDLETEFFIEHTMVVGQPMIIAGAKKTLKTNMALDMAVSLATGDKLLGALRVLRPCRVAMMSGESGLATIRETLLRICHTKGRELSDVTSLIISPDLPLIGDPSHLVALEEFLRGDEIEVLIVDPAYLSMSGSDAGNLFIQGQLLRSLSELCRANDVTMTLVHHTRKNLVNPFDPPELEDIAWAGFQEFARQWMLIGRREPYEIGTGHHRLWVNVGGSAGHSALWAVNISEGTLPCRGWDVEVVRANEAREDAEQRKQDEVDEKRQRLIERDSATILEAFAKFPDGETKNEIKTRCGRSGARFNVALAHLLNEGLVESVRVTKANKQTYDGYKLTNQT